MSAEPIKPPESFLATVRAKHGNPQPASTGKPFVPVRPLTGTVPPYAAKALAEECAILAATPEGQRNSQLNTSAVKIASLAAAGHLPEDDAQRQLLDAALTAGLDEKGALATLRSGWGHGSKTPRDIPVRDEDEWLAGLPTTLTTSSALSTAAPGEPSQEQAAPRRQIILTSAADIHPKPVFWLWAGRLALGTLALLAGRQGLGKSTLAYWLAARITQGELPGQYQGQPRAVLVCATEDSWEHTIVPRLIAAGADLHKVFRVEVLTPEEIHVGLSLPRDNHAVEQAAKDTSAALLLLDPLMSRLGDLDTHKDSEVRQALEPLVAVATRTGMGILGLIHHNKSGSADPLQLVMGSTAFSAVARSVHTVIPDPDDDTDTRRLFGTPKNNLGKTDLPTLAFTVGSHPVPTDQGTAWTGRIVWGEEIAGSISEAMRRSNDDDKTATSEAADWLKDYLTIQGGIAASVDIKKEGRKAGHAERTLDRARQRMHLAVSSSGYPRRTLWHFPTAAPVTPTNDRPVAPQSGHPLRGELGNGITGITEDYLPMSDPVVPVVPVVPGTGDDDATVGVTGESCPLHPEYNPSCFTCDTLAANRKDPK